MSAPQALRAAACRFIAEIPGGRISPELLAPDFDCWNSAMGGQITGEAYLRGISGAARILPDLIIEVDGTVAEDDAVAVRASSRASLPDGRLYVNHYHFLFTFQNGRIRRVHAFMDTKAAEMLLPLVEKAAAG